MRRLRAVLCFVFGHVTRPGVRREMSVTFDCDRCGDLVDGDLAPLRRR